MSDEKIRLWLLRLVERQADRARKRAEARSNLLWHRRKWARDKIQNLGGKT
jgi:hypothetical protein